jgi:hypothetical protein
MKNFDFRKYLPAVLILLVIIDTSLALIGFFFPGFWFGLQHGDPSFVDTQGLLIHSAYFWATYAVLQAIGLFNWKKNKSWIHIFITIRIVDNFLIGSYIYSDTLLLTSAKIVLYGVIPANLILAYYFWECSRVD